MGVLVIFIPGANCSAKGAIWKSCKTTVNRHDDRRRRLPLRQSHAVAARGRRQCRARFRDPVTSGTANPKVTFTARPKAATLMGVIPTSHTREDRIELARESADEHARPSGCGASLRPARGVSTRSSSSPKRPHSPGVRIQRAHGRCGAAGDLMIPGSDRATTFPVRTTRSTVRGAGTFGGSGCWWLTRPPARDAPPGHSRCGSDASIMATSTPPASWASHSV